MNYREQKIGGNWGEGEFGFEIGEEADYIVQLRKKEKSILDDIVNLTKGMNEEERASFVRDICSKVKVDVKEVKKQNWMEQYPDGEESMRRPYYVEFNRGCYNTETPSNTWTLFRSNSLYSEEEWEQMVKENKFGTLFMGRFVHPWNLGEGDLNCSEDGYGFNKKFMRYMVDALNDKFERENFPPPLTPSFGRTTSKNVAIEIPEEINKIVEKRKEDRENKILTPEFSEGNRMAA